MSDDSRTSSNEDKAQRDAVLMETEMHHSTKTLDDRSDELSMSENFLLSSCP